MSHPNHAPLSVSAALLLSGVGSVVAAPDDSKIDFNRDIRPILSENCFSCHGPDEEHRKGKLRLDLKEGAFEEREGFPAFKAGNLEESESWYRITTDDEDDVMPPPKFKKSLTAKQKDLIKRWILEGAEWNSHWSFDPPAQAQVPKGANPIDHFIGKGHAPKGLQFSEQADSRTLLRRLFLDLTGLPPTPEDLVKFQRYVQAMYDRLPG